MDGGAFLRALMGFDFYDDQVFDYQVGAEGHGDRKVFIDDGNGLLLDYGESSGSEFAGQDGLVDRFQEAGTQVSERSLVAAIDERGGR